MPSLYTNFELFNVTFAMRSSLLKQKSHLFWFTGLSGAGKSTLANALEFKLFNEGKLTYVLDGDNVRHGLCGDLGFSEIDRKENIRRIAEMCKLFLDAGVICLAAFISPNIAMRDLVRKTVGKESFSEIYVRCPLYICEERDVKGNYKRARAGLIKNYTGISSLYEEPTCPDLIIDTNNNSIECCINILLSYVEPKIIY